MNVISSYIGASWLKVTGLVMIIDVLICLAGLAFDHTVITGASAWLKPLNFGISVSIFCFTVAFFMSRLPKITLTAAIAAKVMAAALTLEIVLIDLQAARHTTSHFNMSTGFDALVWFSMGSGILLVVLSTVVLTVSAFRALFEDAALGWVVRLSLILVLAGMATGSLMTLPTPEQLAQAKATHRMPFVGGHTVGAPDGGAGLPVTNWSADHGDLRVAHFAGFHGMQLLLLVWWAAPEKAKITSDLHRGRQLCRGVLAAAVAGAARAADSSSRHADSVRLGRMAGGDVSVCDGARVWAAGETSMTTDKLFSLCGALAGLGWLILLLGPVWPKRLRDHLPVCIPIALSFVYAAVILPHWPGHRGGFSSLDQVALLFSDRWLLLAGWVHYLAFDLFIGGWEYGDARQRGVPHLAIVPALILTFLFGPVGFLVYLGTRAVFRRVS